MEHELLTINNKDKAPEQQYYWHQLHTPGSKQEGGPDMLVKARN